MLWFFLIEKSNEFWTGKRRSVLLVENAVGHQFLRFTQLFPTILLSSKTQYIINIRNITRTINLSINIFTDYKDFTESSLGFIISLQCYSYQDCYNYNNIECCENTSLPRESLSAASLPVTASSGWRILGLKLACLFHQNILCLFGISLVRRRYPLSLWNIYFLLIKYPLYFRNILHLNGIYFVSSEYF
jgi:hypothetical protein